MHLARHIHAGGASELDSTTAVADGYVWILCSRIHVSTPDTESASMISTAVFDRLMESNEQDHCAQVFIHVHFLLTML